MASLPRTTGQLRAATAQPAQAPSVSAPHLQSSITSEQVGIAGRTVAGALANAAVIKNDLAQGKISHDQAIAEHLFQRQQKLEKTYLDGVSGAIHQDYINSTGQWARENQFEINPTNIEGASRMTLKQVFNEYRSKPGAIPHVLDALEAKEGTVWHKEFTGNHLLDAQTNVESEANEHYYDRKEKDALDVINKLPARLDESNSAGASNTVIASVVGQASDFIRRSYDAHTPQQRKAILAEGAKNLDAMLNSAKAPLTAQSMSAREVANSMLSLASMKENEDGTHEYSDIHSYASNLIKASAAAISFKMRTLDEHRAFTKSVKDSINTAFTESSKKGINFLLDPDVFHAQSMDGSLPGWATMEDRADGIFWAKMIVAPESADNPLPLSMFSTDLRKKAFQADDQMVLADFNAKNNFKESVIKNAPYQEVARISPHHSAFLSAWIADGKDALKGLQALEELPANAAFKIKADEVDWNFEHNTHLKILVKDIDDNAKVYAEAIKQGRIPESITAAMYMHTPSGMFNLVSKFPDIVKIQLNDLYQTMLAKQAAVMSGVGEDEKARNTILEARKRIKEDILKQMKRPVTEENLAKLSEVDQLSEPNGILNKLESYRDINHVTALQSHDLSSNRMGILRASRFADWESNYDLGSNDELIPLLANGLSDLIEYRKQSHIDIPLQSSLDVVTKNEAMTFYRKLEGAVLSENMKHIESTMNLLLQVQEYSNVSEIYPNYASDFLKQVARTAEKLDDSMLKVGGKNYNPDVAFFFKNPEFVAGQTQITRRLFSRLLSPGMKKTVNGLLPDYNSKFNNDLDVEEWNELIIEQKTDTVDSDEWNIVVRRMAELQYGLDADKDQIKDMDTRLTKMALQDSMLHRPGEGDIGDGFKAVTDQLGDVFNVVPSGTLADQEVDITVPAAQVVSFQKKLKGWGATLSTFTGVAKSLGTIDLMTFDFDKLNPDTEMGKDTGVTFGEWFNGVSKDGETIIDLGSSEKMGETLVQAVQTSAIGRPIKDSYDGLDAGALFFGQRYMQLEGEMIDLTPHELLDPDTPQDVLDEAYEYIETLFDDEDNAGKLDSQYFYFKRELEDIRQTRLNPNYEPDVFVWNPFRELDPQDYKDALEDVDNSDWAQGRMQLPQFEASFDEAEFQEAKKSAKDGDLRSKILLLFRSWMFGEQAMRNPMATEAIEEGKHFRYIPQSGGGRENLRKTNGDLSNVGSKGQFFVDPANNNSRYEVKTNSKNVTRIRAREAGRRNTTLFGIWQLR